MNSPGEFRRWMPGWIVLVNCPGEFRWWIIQVNFNASGSCRPPCVMAVLSHLLRTYSPLVHVYMYIYIYIYTSWIHPLVNSPKLSEFAPTWANSPPRWIHPNLVNSPQPGWIREFTPTQWIQVRVNLLGGEFRQDNWITCTRKWIHQDRGECIRIHFTQVGVNSLSLGEFT